MTIHLIRHGATTAADDRCVGHEDVSLSDDGRRAIEQLGATWAGPPPDRLVSSDLERAHASAHRLAEPWDVSVEQTDRLRELDFGAWTGRTWDAIEAEEGDRLRDWMGDWVKTAPPEGESFEGLTSRVVGWLEEVQDEAPDDATIIAVGHAGPIRALLCHALTLPLNRAFRLRVGCASVSAVTTGRMDWEVECVNAAQFRRPGGP